MNLGRDRGVRSLAGGGVAVLAAAYALREHKRSERWRRQDLTTQMLSAFVRRHGS